MYWINIALVVVAGLNFGFAILVYLLNPKNKINITFALSVFFIAAWTFGMAMFREAKTETEAWVWTWLQNGSGAFLVIPFYFLSIYFPYPHKRIKNWQIGLIVLSIIVISLVVIIPGAWISKIYLVPSNNDYDLNKFGIIYFNIHFYTYLFLAFRNLFQKYRKSDGFIRVQLYYFLISAGIIALFGSIFAVFVPLAFGMLGPYWLGPFFSLPMIIILIYFLYRQR
jgi:hypothetical protein